MGVFRGANNGGDCAAPAVGCEHYDLFGNTKTGKTGTSTSDATETAHIKSVESLDQSNEMERGLKNRHVQFIAIGGTIGTGLFLGSGKSIALTGPSIIFVYIGVGLIMFLLMRAIGEMMYSDPSSTRSSISSRAISAAGGASSPAGRIGSCSF